MHDEKELKWFDRVGVKRPEQVSHELFDTVDKPLSQQLPKLRCSNWRREGNYLVCDTSMGRWAQYLDPRYIVLGDGDDGLPILHKVV